MFIYVLVCGLYVSFFVSHCFCIEWQEFDFHLSSFHVISASLADISKHITGIFRFFGSKRSLWRSTSYLSLLRIPFCLLYRIVRYLCYVLVFFVDLSICLCALCFFFMCHFFCCGLEELDFLLVAFCLGLLFSFSRLFI